jgi:hypothetical protein
MKSRSLYRYHPLVCLAFIAIPNLIMWAGIFWVGFWVGKQF